MKKTTTIINLFGGPGAGKTTCAWEIAAALKKKGFVTEYVSEYAKELVWDEKPEKLVGTLENQTALYEEQKRRVDRLIGKVDFVVTDSPTLLSISYLQEPNREFEERISREFKENNNFCMIVQRGNVFEKEGRVHTLEQSKQIDEDIRQLLVHQNIPFGVYRHSTIDVSIDNMIRVHLGRKRESESHSSDKNNKSSLSLEEQLKSDGVEILEYAQNGVERYGDLVDIVSPQDCADIFGKPVKCGNEIFMPQTKNCEIVNSAERISLNEKISVAEAKAGDSLVSSDLRNKSKEAEL